MNHAELFAPGDIDPSGFAPCLDDVAEIVAVNARRPICVLVTWHPVEQKAEYVAFGDTPADLDLACEAGKVAREVLDRHYAAAPASR